MSRKVLSLTEKRFYYNEQKVLANKIKNIIISNEFIQEINKSLNNFHEVLYPYSMSVAYVYLEWKKYDNNNLDKLIDNLILINDEIKNISWQEKFIILKLVSPIPSKIIISNKLRVKHNLHVNSIIKIKHQVLGLKNFISKKKIEEIENKRKVIIPKLNDEDLLPFISLTFIPSIFFENFQLVFESIRIKNNNRLSIQNIYSSHGIHNNYLDHLVLYIVGDKRKLFFNMFQHGGTYFLQKNFFTYELEKLYVNKYFVWGKSKSYSEVSSFYSKRNIWLLYVIKSLRHFKIKNIIIIVLPSFHNKDYRYDDFFQSSSYETLLNELAPIFDYSKFTYLSLHPINLIKSESTLKKMSLNKYILKKSIYKSMTKTKLIIITYNATVIAEALFVNSPFIIYINKDRDDFNILDEKLFNEAIEVGLIHDNPESLNIFLSNYKSLLNSLHLKMWWDSSKVKNIKRKIKIQYLGL